MGTYQITENCEFKPKRAHSGDAGLDLAIQEEVTLRPGETRYIPAGIKFDLEFGQYVHVLTRSSSFKHFIVIIPTVIDANYKHEISIIVTNFNSYPVHLKKGLYLAQAILSRYELFDNELENTDNNNMYERKIEDKFGSSGE